MMEGSNSAKSYAVLVAARNEEAVISDLLNSILESDYPGDRIKVFVIADNCTDNTAAVAEQNGATVYIRNNCDLIGKGYALSELIRHLKEDFPEGFDGYFVFDADNIISPSFISEMDKKMSLGNDIVTSYRNSKNFSDNWISSGSSIWFLCGSCFFNSGRDALGSSCQISGTGFLFSRKIFESMNDWPYHLLTEDLEFSVNQALDGNRIAFCEKAELYDEQPTDLATSFRQRARWAKGYLQVGKKYGLRLVQEVFKGNRPCFDLLATILPAFTLSLISMICNISVIAVSVFYGDLSYIYESLQKILLAYTGLLLIGATVTVSEWDHIRCTCPRKILYISTFPLFMFTYIPISIYAVFMKAEWKPIPHIVTNDKFLNN